MTKPGSTISGLNSERTIWVEQDELGSEKLIRVGGRPYLVKIPKNIQTKITLRLKNLGKTSNGQTGDLFLHVWLNKGEDLRANLWLSETTARVGAEKLLLLEDRKISIVIPPRSYDGLKIRLFGLGAAQDFSWGTPFLRRKPGNLLVKLIVYPDKITPQYGSFDGLSTDDMVSEGWVYRKIDEVFRKMGRSTFRMKPVQADKFVDLFNSEGWKSIYYALLNRLNLAQYDIEITPSGPGYLPGSCKKTVVSQVNAPSSTKYQISINEQFLDHPFAVAAILAHELCHVVYSEKIGRILNLSRNLAKDKKADLEEERTVDLLVFLFKIGEFQLRLARDTRLTLGYFNQAIFERIQVIVSKKSGLD